jgi:hypothetical protein
MLVNLMQFEDIFKGKFPFCQADVIRQSVQHGD